MPFFVYVLQNLSLSLQHTDYSCCSLTKELFQLCTDVFEERATASKTGEECGQEPHGRQETGLQKIRRMLEDLEGLEERGERETRKQGNILN